MQYNLSEIAAITGGKLIGDDRIVREVSTDSRGSVTGSQTLFVAMRGANHDSHNFLSSMSARGVVAFMVERDDLPTISGASYVVVERAIPALQALARDYRSRFKGAVVGITGSNGKTVVKEWATQAAPSGIKIFRSPRSYNSQLGVALSLLMMEGDEDVALIEAGISKCGEMSKLAEMIRPTVGVITSIGEAHQEGFGSLEQKIEEKISLFAGAERIIYHSDYTELIPYIIYREGCEYVDAKSSTMGDFSDIASQRNSQIVTALFQTLGYGEPQLDHITPIAMRLEVIEGVNNSVIINDSYNNDINSLTIALDTLRSVAAGRETTLILSDILQSGMSSEQLYRAVGKIIYRAKVNKVIGVGREIMMWSDQFHCQTKCYASTEELLSKLSAEDYTSRAILIKGNRESRFEKITHQLSHLSHTTTLEVNLDAMIHNLNHYRGFLKRGEKLVAMVKASSYGAGEYEVAQILQHQGVDYLAVAFADEGSRMRERGITMPIIVLNADDGSFSQMVDMQLEPEIYSVRSLRAFAQAVEARGERDYPIHIKLDTGMHRLGFIESDIQKLLTELESLKGVVTVASIFSHLATADMGSDGREATLSQIALFDRVSRKIIDGVGHPVLRHIANSAGISEYPEAHFNMCRLGIGLYGFGDDGLRAVSTLKSRIVQIKDIERGSKIGYGGAGEAGEGRRIATIPVGYADGLDRHLGCGAWSVLIGGEPAPIIGRICMDSCMVDISDIEVVSEGDEVVIFSEKEGNRASDMAQILGTISYEILTSISTRVKRIYLKE
ncbi:MAG: alanine racemase [Rikenellaceae bacterium]